MWMEGRVAALPGSGQRRVNLDVWSLMGVAARRSVAAFPAPTGLLFVPRGWNFFFLEEADLSLPPPPHKLPPGLPVCKHIC